MWEVLTDIINFILCILFVLYFTYRFKPPRLYSCLLLASCATPFLLNDVLFPADYMPDQFRYFDSVKAFRTVNFSAIDESSSVAIAASMLALVPLPFAETIKSLGFFNKLIFLFIFSFLYAKKYVDNKVYIFLIAYPSLLMYSSLSLRDTLILLIMFISFYLAVKGRLLLSLIFLVPLFYIKFQNFFLQVTFILAYFLFNVRANGISLRNILYVAACTIGLILVVSPYVIPLLNEYRLDMLLEDGGMEHEFIEISNTYDLIFSGLKNGFYFLLKPFPWDAQNILQLVQSIENIVVLIFVFFVTQKCLHHNPRRSLFWIAFLIGSSLIYGLVVFNFGAAARYRFPFIALYIIFITHDVFYKRESSSKKVIKNE